MYYTYVIKSIEKDGLYTGSTSNLKRRMLEHNKGLNLSTKNGKPWHVIYYEACMNEKDAKRREYYLKTTQGKKMLKRRIIEYWKVEWSKDLVK